MQRRRLLEPLFPKPSLRTRIACATRSASSRVSNLVEHEPAIVTGSLRIATFAVLDIFLDPAGAAMLTYAADTVGSMIVSRYGGRPNS